MISRFPDLSPVQKIMHFQYTIPSIEVLIVSTVEELSLQSSVSALITQGERAGR